MYLPMPAKAKHKLFSISDCFVQWIPYVKFSRMASFTKQIFLSTHCIWALIFFNHLRWYKYELEVDFVFKETSA